MAEWLAQDDTHLVHVAGAASQLYLAHFWNSAGQSAASYALPTARLWWLDLYACTKG